MSLSKCYQCLGLCIGQFAGRAIFVFDPLPKFFCSTSYRRQWFEGLLVMQSGKE